MNLRTQSETYPAGTQREHGFGRLGFWWLPKVGPALAVGYCAALVLRVPGWPTVIAIATVAFVGFCVGTYGYLLNDIFDLEVDRKARKPNCMATYSGGQRFLFCALAVALSLTPALLGHTSHRTLIILGFEFIVLTSYSMPPVRLKSRGAFGLLGDAAGAHVVANLYVLSVLADAAPQASMGTSPKGIALCIGLLCVWQLCLGLVGILVHQVEDRENDLRSGIRTFVTERTFLQVRTPATALFAGEIVAFVGLCFILRNVAPLVGIAAALYTVLIGFKICCRWRHYHNFASESTLREWWLSSHSYYEAWFPFVAALQCALLHPEMAMLAALHLTVFVPVVRAQLYDAANAIPYRPLPEEPA